MAAEGRDRDAPREIRLEGPSLWLVAVALAALLAGAFEAGRLVERRGPSAEARSGADPLAGLSSEPETAPEKLTFFDSSTGGGKEAEPQREAAGKPSVPTPPPRTAPPSAGPWFVQVFVGRDRAAAAEVVRGLEAKGYPVTTAAVSEGGSDSLFKVRVGGFASRGAAEATAERLHKDGQASTWVVRVGG